MGRRLRHEGRHLTVDDGSELDWRQRILVEHGGCPGCESSEQNLLMARDVITHLVGLCADYERRLAQPRPVTVIVDTPAKNPS